MEDETQPHRASTDLIDVSDVATELDEVTAAPRTRRSTAEYGENFSAPLPVDDAPTVASLKERLCAFLLDGMFLYTAYWFLMVAYRRVAFDQAAGPIPTDATHGLIFHGLYLLIAFLYFLLFESVLFATPGKLLCRLRVRRSNGGPPSIMACTLRTIMRPVDIVLMPLIIPVACMEWSARRMRLGDMLAKTIVVRTLAASPRRHDLILDMIPSASSRFIAFLIDLGIFGTFAAGYALLLSPDHPLVSMFLVVLAPVAMFLFLAVPEAAIKTSTGKWLMGYTIFNEDGSLVGLSGAVMRTLFRPFDTNPFGFLCMLASVRRQRPGDCAAGTVVCRIPRRWNALAGIGILIAVAASLAYGGISNRHSFLSSTFRINFLPTVSLTSRRGAFASSEKGVLSIRSFDFAAGDAQATRRPAVFQPGETVFLVFNVEGGTERDGMLWLQEDLTVRYPDGSMGIKIEDVINFKERVDRGGPIEMINSIALPPDAMPGRYTTSIVMRDMHSGRQLNEQRFFYVTARSPSPGSPTP